MSDITDERWQIAQLAPGLPRAAGQYGTPVYVVDMVAVAAAARQIEAALRPVPAGPCSAAEKE